MGFFKRSGDNDVEGVRWRVADVTHPLFGEFFLGDVWADEDMLVVREKACLVEFDDSCVFVQMVADDVFRIWQEDRFSKAIADPHVLPIGKSGGKRFKGEMDAVAMC